MPRFIETIRPTNFGFYDSDPLFQNEADAVVSFVTSRLGENILSVELTRKMVWRNMEEAAMQLNALLVEYQAKSNISSILGMPTGSIDASTGLPTINLSNVYIQQNLSFLEDMAAPYAASIGYGSSAESYSGSIDLRAGVQDYDLYTELLDSNGVPIFNNQPSGSVGRLVVYEVFHGAPVQHMYNSNISSNFAISGLPLESYTSNTRFYMLPLFEDILRTSMLKSAQRIRRSNYSYRISGRMFRMFPVPRSVIEGFDHKIWLRVGFRQHPLPQLASSLIASGTSAGVTGAGSGASFQNDSTFGAGNPMTLPYGPFKYSSLNIWARNWIAQYTLAVSTEQLGRVRSKFQSFPVAGETVQLDGSELVSSGREDKVKLLESAKEVLDSLTFDKIAEREAMKAEQMVKQLSFVPVNPKYALFLG